MNYRAAWRPLGASIILAFGLVMVGASPASAATTLASGTTQSTCNAEMGGEVPSASDFSTLGVGLADQERTHYLIGYPSMGYQLRFACTFREGNSTVYGKNLTGVTALPGSSSSALYETKVKTAGGSVVSQRDLRALAMNGVTGTTTDETMGGYSATELRLTQMLRASALDGFGYLRGTVLYHPPNTVSRNETNNLQCQINCSIGAGQKVLWRRQAVIRLQFSSTATGTDQSNSYEATGSFNTGQNDDGSITGHDTEFVDVTGATPPAGGNGDCVIKSWYLYDTVTGDHYTSQDLSLDRTLVSGRSYEIRMSFSGSPVNIQATATVLGVTIWHKSVFNPVSPLAMGGLVGTGKSAAVFVFGSSTDGTVSSSCLALVSSEAEWATQNLDDCMSSATSDLDLTKPKTWINYLLKGSGCLLSVAFVPSKGMSDRANELEGTNPVALSISETVDGLTTGFAHLDDAEGTGCQGPAVHIGTPETVHPFDLCTGGAAEIAGWVHLALSGIVVMGTAVSVVNLLSQAILGRKTEWSFGEPMGTAQGGTQYGDGEWV